MTLNTNNTYKKSERRVKVILQNWLRIINIKLGWIPDFDKIVAKYAKYFIPLYSLQGCGDAINSVKFSPDDRNIVVSIDNIIQIWNIESGQQIQTFKGHSKEVFFAEYSPDGHSIVSCSRDNTVRIWDVNSGKEKQALINDSSNVRDVRFIANGTKIQSCYNDSTLITWNLTSGDKVKESKGKGIILLHANISPAGQFLICETYSGKIRVWDKHLKKDVKILKGHSGKANDAKYLPDAQTIVSCGNDKQFVCGM
ncbi:WD repeat-containing protein [Reticulomyxa filosa]|uniref:WD repeat-containing protein n=1 Tax=Reticulomyxa filosa TaxID=46433 RepID=X6M3G5_RETFI|nr:WD repeat-containing protein [Reticulomyxa filosa]|eukprot:ETO08513.1 WD repeat-containing protein [Reticulomyxa filosa]